MHRAAWSRALSRWADVVFAEWCLGNAVWHAANRREDTGLVIRLHRFELESDLPAELDIERVDAVVFVSEHVRDRAVGRFQWPRTKTVVIPNAVDAAALDRPKADSARFTLGLLTWDRQVKRLDLALDLLEALRREEPRMRLRLKGRSPEDVNYVWKHADERVYFREQYRRISSSPLLREAVIFDPHGDDVAEWLTGVGHILSPSDVESFHLALAEGMASGAVPVVFDREGARALFTSRWVVPDVAAAARAILQHVSGRSLEAEGRAAAELIAERYDRSAIDDAWWRLVKGAADLARVRAVG